MIATLIGLGLQDYFEQHPYDRNWIYRSYKGETIVDLMWAMANQRAAVDESWLKVPKWRPMASISGCLLPKRRCGASSTSCSATAATGPMGSICYMEWVRDIDWRRLLRNLNERRSASQRAAECFRLALSPARPRIAVLAVERAWLAAPGCERRSRTGAERARLFDSRPWFTPTLIHDDRIERTMRRRNSADRHNESSRTGRSRRDRLDGGFGHGFYRPDAGAARCGVLEVDTKAIRAALEQIA